MQNNIFSGLIVGQNFVSLKEVDSTNTFLKSILANSEPVPEGTVIMAESQVAGRGQFQNKWYSSTGESLAISILLKPAFLNIADQFNLTRAVSLGVYNALLPLVGDALKIKWPNDIYIGNRKLGGILIENQVQGAAIKNAIIGIGINVNQHHFPEWVPNATSLQQTLHTNYDLKAVMSQICSHIEEWYIKLQQGNVSLIAEAYHNALYKVNTLAKFKVQDVIFDGVICGVNPAGLLQVRQGENTVEYNLKEIQFIHD